MAQAIQGRHRRPDRHGLPDAHFPNDHPEAGLGDDEADAGHRLVVRRPAVEVLGGDGLGEGRAGEAEVAHHRESGSWLVTPSLLVIVVTEVTVVNGPGMASSEASSTRPR